MEFTQENFEILQKENEEMRGIIKDAHRLFIEIENNGIDFKNPNILQMLSRAPRVIQSIKDNPDMLSMFSEENLEKLKKYANATT